MKKSILVVMLMALSAAAQAQEIVEGGIRYYGNYMGQATIAAFQDTALEGDIVIPSTLYYQGDKLTVYKFEQYAFSGCTRMRSVVIPASVNETLYDCGYEFYGCTSLEQVTLSPNMQVLQGMFMGCKALKKIELPVGVKYLDYVFENCTALEDVTLPQGLLEIGIECFYGCTSLRQITLPASVSSIGRDAFAYCRGLDSVTCLAAIPPTCLAQHGPHWEATNPFVNIAPNATLYVPAEALALYQSTYPWSTFYKIEALNPNGVDAVTIDCDSEEDWWNLKGEKVVNPVNGVYIHKGKKYLLRSSRD